MATSFIGGAYTDHKFHLASEVTEYKNDAINAAQGQANLITLNQQLTKNRKADEKVPCINTAIPADDLKLLK